MAFYNHEYPYTDPYRYNNDWLLAKMKELVAAFGKVSDDFNALKTFVEDYFKSNAIYDIVKEQLDEYLNDGTFASIIDEYFTNRKVPISANADVLERMYQCIRTYILNSSKLAYITTSSGNNAWDYENGPEIITNDVGKTGYAIQCSVFCHLITGGIRFEDSMYNTENGLTNHFFGAGYGFNIYGENVTAENYTKYRFVRNILPRYIELGLAEPTDPIFSNVHAGDIIFFSNQDVKTPENASHMAFVLSEPYIEFTDSTEAMFLIAEAFSTYNPIRVSYITCNQLISRGVYYVARPPFQATPAKAEGLISNIGLVNTSVSVHPNTPMYFHEIVTLDFDFTPQSLTSYVNFRANGDALITAMPINTITKPKNAGYVGVKQHYTIPIAVTNPQSKDADDIEIEYMTIYNVNSGILENVNVYRGLLPHGMDILPTFYSNNSDFLAIINEMISERFKISTNAGYINDIHYININNITSATFTATNAITGSTYDFTINAHCNTLLTIRKSVVNGTVRIIIDAYIANSHIMLYSLDFSEITTAKYITY